MPIPPEAQTVMGPYATYLERWEAGRGLEFFDMTTMIRLATAVETLLREFYVSHVGGLPSDRGVFQRVLPWSNDSVQALYERELGVALAEFAQWRCVQELMLHRHLYAHTSGLVDERYVRDWLRLTGEDLRGHPALEPLEREAVYWFRPLSDLSRLIEQVRAFFAAFPEAGHASVEGAPGNAV